MIGVANCILHYVPSGIPVQVMFVDKQTHQFCTAIAG